MKKTVQALIMVSFLVGSLAGQAHEQLIKSAARFFRSDLMGKIAERPIVGTGIQALKDIPRGTPLLTYHGNRILPGPTIHSVQFDRTWHIETEGDSKYVNHSNNPNCGVKYAIGNQAWPQLVSLEKILRGQELFFNYNTTEWDMIGKFNDETQKGPSLVGGFSRLPPEIQNILLPLSAPHIQELMRELSFKKN